MLAVGPAGAARREVGLLRCRHKLDRVAFAVGILDTDEFSVATRFPVAEFLGRVTPECGRSGRVGEHPCLAIR